MKRVFALVIATNLLLATTAIAEPLPVHLPHGLYQDADNAANAIRPPPGMKGKYREYLTQVIQQNPHNVAARVARAYQLKNAGALDRAHEDLDLAAVDAVPGSPQAQHVLWSRGWVNYDLGNYAGALDDWAKEVDVHGGSPFWAAYSFALLYWTVDDHDTAMAWYDAAVASDADWGTDGGVAAHTEHWRAAQKDAMQAAFAEWKRRHEIGGAAR